LDQLAEFLKEFTDATGVYIGKLVPPMVEISDEADENAHINEEDPKVIKIIHASKDHRYLVDTVLKSDEGISHDAFAENENEEEEGGDDNSEDADKIAKSEDILDAFKHIYVEEVVREPRMHFWKVPRLGSYLAVPMIYESCMFEDALDQAVENH